MKQSNSTLSKAARLILALMMLCALPVAAQQNTRRTAAPGGLRGKPAPIAIKKASGEVKTAYGIIGFDGTDSNLLNGLVSFPIEEGGKFSLVKYLGDESHDVTAGAYANGYYYYSRTQTDLETQAMIPVDLKRYDMENDEVTTVGTLSGFTSHINDMSYDYSTGTMYAISVKDNVYSVLYTIDLNTAAAKAVATLDRRFFTLACSYAGQLYAVSFDGDFCKVDKTSGAVEVVGATGWHPTFYQSMEFDHSDETLYWAANLIQGTDNDDCIATIDLATGTASKVAAVGDYPQIAGLYLPFSASAKGTPAAVDNLIVEPGANGAATAELTWTNPSKTFDGQALTAISAVKVYRNHKLVKTFTSAKPGEHMTYIDNVGTTKGAVYNYTVVASNEVGEGAEAKDAAFIGHDVPAGVGGLKIAVTDFNKVSLSWSQSDEGPSGGWVDKSTLTYTVTRYPDGKVVASGLKDTHVDDVVDKTQQCYYSVQARNADGESNVLSTRPQTIGPAYAMPASFDFTSESADNSWTVVDANNDGYAWMWTTTSSSRVMGHQASNTVVSDDWLIGYYMPFTKDGVYRIDINYHAYSPDKVELYLLDKMNVETPLESIGTMNIQGSRDMQHYSVIFKAPATGYYNLGLHAVSPMRADWLEFYNLSLREAENVNLAATAISGDASPVQGKESKYVVTVENQGKNKVYGFRVVLKDQDGNELVHKDDARTIKSGESLDVELAWKPESTTTTGVRGEVTMPWATGANADANPDDNETELMAVKVREAFDGNVVALGTESEKTASYGPFDFSKQYAAALNIYGADEIGTGSKGIVKIAWPYDAAWQYSDVSDVPVRVYMCNTELTNTKDGWIPEADMTLVYDGTVSVPQQSTGELTLSLDTPFAYSGKNLAVLTVICSDTYAPYLTFKQYTSPLADNAALEWGSYRDKVWFDWTQSGHQDYYQYTASVLLYLSDKTSGIDAATSDSLDGTAYTIYDLSGKKVANGTFAAGGTVDTGALERGVYVVGYKLNGKQNAMKISVNK